MPGKIAGKCLLLRRARPNEQTLFSFFIRFFFLYILACGLQRTRVSFSCVCHRPSCSRNASAERERERGKRGTSRWQKAAQVAKNMRVLPAESLSQSCNEPQQLAMCVCVPRGEAVAYRIYVATWLCSAGNLDVGFFCRLMVCFAYHQARSAWRVAKVDVCATTARLPLWQPQQRSTS